MCNSHLIGFTCVLCICGLTEALRQCPLDSHVTQQSRGLWDGAVFTPRSLQQQTDARILAAKLLLFILRWSEGKATIR